MNIYEDKDKHFISRSDWDQKLESLRHADIKTNGKVLSKNFNVARDIKVEFHVTKARINNIRFCECTGNELGKIKSDTSFHLPGCKHDKITFYPATHANVAKTETAALTLIHYVRIRHVRHDTILVIGYLFGLMLDVMGCSLVYSYLRHTFQSNKYYITIFCTVSNSSLQVCIDGGGSY